MTRDPWWRRYWRSLGFGPEVAEEIEFHIDRIAEGLMAQGMPAGEARREAERRFGDRRHVQTQLEKIERGRGRRLRLVLWLEELWADLRYGARGLLKRPAYTLTAAISLALGISVTTVVISIVDAWMFKPLPVDKPDRLVVIGASSTAVGGIVYPGVALSTATELAKQTDLFEEMAGWRLVVAALRRSSTDQPRRSFLFSTTGNYFQMLGVKPEVGRVYSDADARERASVVVLDYAFWSERLGADRGIVGKPVFLGGAPFTVIGVADRRFRGTEHAVQIDGYVSVGSEGTLDPSFAAVETDPNLNFFELIARSRPGVAIGQVRSALDAEAGRLVAQFPNLAAGYHLKAYHELDARPTIAAAGFTNIAGYALLVLAGLILATAVVNVSNLVLTRASGRQEEVAVRFALGASRARVIRQLLAESALLGTLGFLGAVGLAALAVRWAVGVPVTTQFPLRIDFAVDRRVLVASLLVALGAGLLSGVGPALVASNRVQGTLRRAGRDKLGGLGNRLRATLVVGQVAASFLVLITAGLFIESLRRAGTLDLGMKPERVLTGLFQPNQRLTGATASQTLERIALRLRDQVGVEAVSVANSVPMQPGGGPDPSDIYLEEGTVGGKAGAQGAMHSAVDTAYFSLMGIPSIAGRRFLASDDSAAPRVAIINQEAANRWFPGRDPLGRRFRVVQDGPPLEVVGVVPTSRYLLISEAPRPFFYTPVAQAAFSQGTVLIKSRLAPGMAEEALRAAAATVQPDLVPVSVSTMEDAIKGLNGLLPLRFASDLAGAIGLLAAILTMLGLYGVLAYSVSQETREIGVRMALGANPRSIVRRVVGRGGRLVGIGVVIGGALALGVTRLLGRLLIGVSPTELSVYLGVTALVTGIAGVAAYLPARRAARLDPVRALRE